MYPKKAKELEVNLKSKLRYFKKAQKNSSDFFWSNGILIRKLFWPVGRKFFSRDKKKNQDGIAGGFSDLIHWSNQNWKNKKSTGKVRKKPNL